jgi:hypothetical protein
VHFDDVNQRFSAPTGWTVAEKGPAAPWVPCNGIAVGGVMRVPHIISSGLLMLP